MPALVPSTLMRHAVNPAGACLRAIARDSACLRMPVTAALRRIVLERVQDRIGRDRHAALPGPEPFRRPASHSTGKTLHHNILIYSRLVEGPALSLLCREPGGYRAGLMRAAWGCP